MYLIIIKLKFFGRIGHCICICYVLSKLLQVLPARLVEPVVLLIRKIKMLVSFEQLCLVGMCYEHLSNSFRKNFETKNIWKKECSKLAINLQFQGPIRGCIWTEWRFAFTTKKNVLCSICWVTFNKIQTIVKLTKSYIYNWINVTDETVTSW